MSLQLASSVGNSGAVVIFTSNHGKFKFKSGGFYVILTLRSFC